MTYLGAFFAAVERRDPGAIVIDRRNEERDDEKFQPNTQSNTSVTWLLFQNILQLLHVNNH